MPNVLRKLCIHVCYINTMYVIVYRLHKEEVIHLGRGRGRGWKGKDVMVCVCVCPQEVQLCCEFCYYRTLPAKETGCQGDGSLVKHSPCKYEVLSRTHVKSQTGMVIQCL